jgi:hypothetical protein
MGIKTSPHVVHLGDLVVVAKQDASWLTEKALRTDSRGNTMHGRFEIERRRIRIESALDAASQLIQAQQKLVSAYCSELDALRKDLSVALIGLRDFLAAIEQLPMPDDTRAVVSLQLEAVNAALVVPSGNPQQG